MTRIRNKISLLKAVFICVVLNNCGTCLYEKKLSDELISNIKILQNEKPILEGAHIYNPVIITQLYDEGKRFLSTKWEHRENIDQMLNAIESAYSERLNPEDYHYTVIRNLVKQLIN